MFLHLSHKRTGESATLGFGMGPSFKILADHDGWLSNVDLGASVELLYSYRLIQCFSGYTPQKKRTARTQKISLEDDVPLHIVGDFQDVGIITSQCTYIIVSI